MVPSYSLFPEDLDHVLQHTQGLWEELRGRRVFLTGGTGFFGTWLLESFLWANDQLGLDAQLMVLSRRPESFCQRFPRLSGHPAVGFLQGDVRSFSFPEGPFSHVIHAATDTSAQLYAEHPLVMYETIVAGTQRVLDFARHAGAARLLLTSSGAVYGRQPTEVSHVAEDYVGAPDPMAPASAYGHGKRAAEHLCALYAREYGLATTIARGFAFVGPYLPLDRHFAIGNFLGNVLRGEPIVVQGDGTPYRSYLYAADMAAWLWTILVRGVACRPYNVGSEAEMAIGELAEMVTAVDGHRCPVTILQRPNPAARPARYVPSVQRATSELGLKAWIDLPEAIARTLRWQKTPGAYHGNRRIE